MIPRPQDIALTLLAAAIVAIGPAAAADSADAKHAPQTTHKTQTIQLSDSAIAKILIRESIADYPGNCPCPYNRDRAGRRCGRRSAYSKPGGYEPLCYRRDVTKRMIDNYRKRHKR